MFRLQTLESVKTDLHLFWRATPRWRASSAKPLARYLNIGAGHLGVQSNEWLNVDGFDRRADVLCNAGRPLPFASGRFDGIFTEHMLEHLTPQEGSVFLSECHRILKPSRVIRVVVPDGELYIRNYFDNREWMLERRKGHFARLWR